MRKIHINKTITLFIVIVFTGLFYSCTDSKQKKLDTSIVKKEIKLLIKPSATDSTITAADAPHLVMYDASIPQGKLLLFLPGTNGIPTNGSIVFFKTAIEQGYRSISLSYINKQAVAAICKGENLVNDCDCTQKFRNHRIYGEEITSLIPDEPQDAIINRFTKLLMYLTENDKNGNWGIYLKNGAINWDMITISGQSQGGGMATFIAQRELVNRVITFSGGWDYSERNDSGKNKIAKWYFDKSVTPSDRWFGTYHSKESTASIIDDTYKAMGIPRDHIYAFDKAVRAEGKREHSDGVRNVAYKDIWIELLGSGAIN